MKQVALRGSPQSKERRRHRLTGTLRPAAAGTTWAEAHLAPDPQRVPPEAGRRVCGLIQLGLWSCGSTGTDKEKWLLGDKEGMFLGAAGPRKACEPTCSAARTAWGWLTALHTRSSGALRAGLTSEARLKQQLPQPVCLACVPAPGLLWGQGRGWGGSLWWPGPPRPSSWPPRPPQGNRPTRPLKAWGTQTDQGGERAKLPKQTHFPISPPQHRQFPSTPWDSTQHHHLPRAGSQLLGCKTT